ncbi:MAG TPA: ACP phosphodiesterase [Bacteroidia bacterium]|nr:ACP phosphodiesterase [Bacteroidia bacterium]
MNFLAHLYLSFDDDAIMIGNFIADHVKGKTVNDFSDSIQKGIRLHRAIDAFTDSHSVVEETRIRLRPEFRKYAPVISDIFYDHFLAAAWNDFSQTSLDQFAASFYSIANRHLHEMPQRTQKMLPVMVQHDWLTSYRTIEGIGAVLTGMSRRTAFESRMEYAAAELTKNYDSYKKEFRVFFPELITFAKNKLEEITSAYSGE